MKNKLNAKTNAEKKRSLSGILLSSPYLVWSTIFIIAPMFFVVYYAFTDRNGNFTFDNISQLGDYAGIFIHSIWIGLISTIICLVLAYPMAYIMARSGARRQKTLMMLVMLPMWMNLLIRTYSWMTLLQDTGIINNVLAAIGLPRVHMIDTAGAVIVGMVYNFFPYMILPIYSVMSKIDKNVVEAAQDLGCNKLNVFRKVLFPLSLPGVVSGITMVFVPSVSTFYIAGKLGGPSNLLIGDVVETQFKASNNYNLGSAISLVLMVLILICMAVMNKFADDDTGMIV